MEDVAGAGGVDGVDAKRRGVAELRAVIGQDAVVAESCGREPRAESATHGGECPAEVGFAGYAAGNVAAGDEVIDQREQSVDAGIQVVEIGEDGNACGTGPSGGGDGRSGVMTIEMERAGTEDPFALQVLGL